jgi:hypothetical protein
MHLISTKTELFDKIARETARMSYPGSMSRGTKPVVAKGTKKTLEEYFAIDFPLPQVWHQSSEIAIQFDQWHTTRVDEIARAIQALVSTHNEPRSVAAKFLNTFMHQLMKYEPCRPLLPVLHLPLDARVFATLSKLHVKSLAPVQDLLSRSPYSLPYEDHIQVQRALLAFVNELNARPETEFKIHSRIELNWLWV